MTLLKINDILTKTMISTFVGIVVFTFIGIVLPIVTYLIAVLLIALLIIGIVNFGLSTYLIIKQIKAIIDAFFKQYEHPHN